MKKSCMPENFPKNLRELRLQYGMSQNELGRSVGYGQNHISYWETGRNFPGIEALLGLSQVFMVSLDSLLFHPNVQMPGCNVTCLAYKRTTEAETHMDEMEKIEWRKTRDRIRAFMEIKDENTRKKYLKLLTPIVDDLYILAVHDVLDKKKHP